MRPIDLAILAAGPGAGDIFEVLIGLAVFVIWVIASIAGAIRKRKGQAEPAETPDEPMIVFEPPPVPVPPQPPPRRKPKSRPPRMVVESPPPPPPTPTAPAYAVRGERVAEQSKPRTPSTAALVRRLLRDDAIRGGVVLSEVLQPPVGLRPPRDPSQ